MIEVDTPLGEVVSEEQIAVVLKLGMFAMGFFCLYLYLDFLSYKIILKHCLLCMSGNCDCMLVPSHSVCVTLLQLWTVA